jgi:hypothetical protein
MSIYHALCIAKSITDDLLIIPNGNPMPSERAWIVRPYTPLIPFYGKVYPHSPTPTASDDGSTYISLDRVIVDGFAVLARLCTVTHPHAGCG